MLPPQPHQAHVRANPMSKTWAWHSPEDRITSQASTFPQAMGIPDSIPTRTALGLTIADSECALYKEENAESPNFTGCITTCVRWRSLDFMFIRPQQPY